MKRINLKSIERLVLSFLLVILIPFFSSLFLFRQTLSIVTNKTNDYTRAMLEQIRTIVDGKWDSFASMAYDFSTDAKIISFIYAGLPLEDSRYYSIWDIQSSLKHYAVADDFLSEFGIYFLRSDTIVTTQEVRRLQSFYNMYFSGTFASFESFNRRLSQPGSRGIFLEPVILQMSGSRQAQVLPYVYRFSSNQSATADGYFFYFVSMEALNQLLSQADVFSKGNIYITQGSTPIWSLTNNSEIAADIVVGEDNYSFTQKGDVIIAYLTSDQWGWTYYLEVPNSVLLDGWDSFKSIITPLLLILVLEVAVVLIISYLNSKPIVKMMDALSGLGENPWKSRRVDDMKFLESSINRLIEDNSSLENVVNRHYPILEMEFINNLCRGEYTSEAEINSAKEAMGISIEGSSFLVMLAVIAEHSDYLIATDKKDINNHGNGRLLLMETVEALGKKLGVRTSLYEKNKVILLIPSNQCDQEMFKQTALAFAGAVKQAMLQEYGIFLSLFGGNICRGMEYISLSFEEARSAYEFYWDSEETREVFWADSILQNGYVHSYTLEKQDRLLHLVGAGKESEVLQILEDIYQNHFVRTKYPLAERTQLLIEIRGTLLKLYERFKLDYSLFHIYVEDCNRGNEETFRYMMSYFSSLCKMSGLMRTDKASRLKESVLEFIHANYKDAGLSLSMLCERFSIGEASLSQFFKSNTGETISQYVENLRITEACRLLEGTESAIAQIALDIGYSNDKSFRRAFKRIKGISPTEYRKAAFKRT